MLTKYRQLVGFLSSLTCLVALMLSSEAFALYPGDCGKPTTSGTLTPTGLPMATDALATLKGATGSSPCTKKICDVDSSGAVRATDALIVLVESVSGVANLDCPSTCDTGECICTAADLIDLLDHVDDNPAPTRLAPGVIALLHCSTSSVSPTVFQVPKDDWVSGLRTINAADAWINGLATDTTSYFSRIELSPLCYSICVNSSSNNCSVNADCNGGNICVTKGCSLQTSKPCATNTDCQPNDGTCTVDLCPTTESGTNFLTFNGAKSGIAGVTIRGFDEGVHFSSTEGTVGNVTFDRVCDSSINNKSGSLGNEVRNTYFLMGCRKCTQGQGAPAISPSCQGRSCYHVAYYSDHFQGCKVPMEETQQGTHLLVSGGDMAPIVTTPAYPCTGPVFSARDMVSLVDEVTVDKCTTGWLFSGRDSVHSVEDSILKNSIGRGIRTEGDPTQGIGATVTLLRSRILDSGGQGNDVAGPEGGLTLWEDGVMSIGDGTSDNANKICGNRNPSGVAQEVENLRGDFTVPATQNYWGQSGGPQAGEIDGLVTTNPHRSGDPFTGDSCAHN